MYARIADGQVLAVTTEHPELAPGECAVIVECGDEVQPGWLFQGGVCTAPPEVTLAEAKAAKQVEITAGAEAALAGLKAEYCATEITTWDQQYEEAKTFAADSAASVPLLTAIATARGQAVAELAQKVIANRAAWVVISGGVVGQRLAYQDRLDAAQTVAVVQAIAVGYAVTSEV